MEYYKQCRQDKYCPTLEIVPIAPSWLGIGGAMIVLEASYCADSVYGTHTFQICFTESNAGLEPTSARQLYGKSVCI